jgi:hypothetical protein
MIDGGLMSYGDSIDESYRHTGISLAVPRMHHQTGATDAMKTGKPWARDVRFKSALVSPARLIAQGSDRRLVLLTQFKTTPKTNTATSINNAAKTVASQSAPWFFGPAAVRAPRCSARRSLSGRKKSPR